MLTTLPDIEGLDEFVVNFTSDIPSIRPVNKEIGNNPKARSDRSAESKTANKAEYLNMIAGQIIFGALGFVFDHVLDHRFDMWLTSTTRR